MSVDSPIVCRFFFPVFQYFHLFTVILTNLFDVKTLFNGLRYYEGGASDASSAAAAPKVEPDEMIVVQLSSMGFPVNRCMKAAVRTK